MDSDQLNPFPPSAMSLAGSLAAIDSLADLGEQSRSLACNTRCGVYEHLLLRVSHANLGQTGFCELLVRIEESQGMGEYTVGRYDVNI